MTEQQDGEQQSESEYFDALMEKLLMYQMSSVMESHESILDAVSMVTASALPVEERLEIAIEQAGGIQKVFAMPGRMLVSNLFLAGLVRELAEALAITMESQGEQTREEIMAHIMRLIVNDAPVKNAQWLETQKGEAT
jgi:hypothetical protein